jgi:hypothetical protein
VCGGRAAAVHRSSSTSSDETLIGSPGGELIGKSFRVGAHHSDAICICLPVEVGRVGCGGQRRGAWVEACGGEGPERAPGCGRSRASGSRVRTTSVCGSHASSPKGCVATSPAMSLLALMRLGNGCRSVIRCGIGRGADRSDGIGRSLGLAEAGCDRRLRSQVAPARRGRCAWPTCAGSPVAAGPAGPVRVRFIVPADWGPPRPRPIEAAPTSNRCLTETSQGQVSVRRTWP